MECHVPRRRSWGCRAARAPTWQSWVQARGLPHMTEKSYYQVSGFVLIIKVVWFVV